MRAEFVKRRGYDPIPWLPVIAGRIVNSREESDRFLLNWLRGVGREFVVVATKADRLSGNERTRNLLALKKGLEVETIMAVSAKTSSGIKELWARVEEVGKVAEV